MNNISKLVETVKSVMDINIEVHIVPMRIKLDDTAYAYKVMDRYFIYINKDILKKDKITNFIIRVIIHEMWHIKQMIEGDLLFNENFTIVYWKGTEYSKEFPYENRPFEIEARKAENKYFKQVKKLLKN